MATNIEDVFSNNEEVNPEENAALWINPKTKFVPPKFRRDSTLDEDLEDLLKKWKGRDNEVLVHHMIDSLIIFNHNRKYLDDANSCDKLREAFFREISLVPDNRKE